MPAGIAERLITARSRQSLLNFVPFVVKNPL